MIFTIGFGIAFWGAAYRVDYGRSRQELVFHEKKPPQKIENESKNLDTFQNWKQKFASFFQKPQK